FLRVCVPFTTAADVMAPAAAATSGHYLSQAMLQDARLHEARLQEARVGSTVPAVDGKQSQLQLARLQLARSGSAATLQLARLQEARAGSTDPVATSISVLGSRPTL